MTAPLYDRDGITLKQPEESATRECLVSEWAGCYDDSWRGLIVDEAFAH